MKFRYNDKVIVVKDEENDGFYVGLTGLVNDKMKSENGDIYVVYEEKGMHSPLTFREDQLQKI